MIDFSTAIYDSKLKVKISKVDDCPGFDYRLTYTRDDGDNSVTFFREVSEATLCHVLANFTASAPDLIAEEKR